MVFRRLHAYRIIKRSVGAPVDVEGKSNDREVAILRRGIQRGSLSR